MRRKRTEQAERRRPLIELNLISEGKGKKAVRRRGCVSFLGVLGIPLGALAAVLLVVWSLRLP